MPGSLQSPCCVADSLQSEGNPALVRNHVALGGEVSAVRSLYLIGGAKCPPEHLERFTEGSLRLFRSSHYCLRAGYSNFVLGRLDAKLVGGILSRDIELQGLLVIVDQRRQISEIALDCSQVAKGSIKVFGNP